MVTATAMPWISTPTTDACTESLPEGHVGDRPPQRGNVEQAAVGRLEEIRTAADSRVSKLESELTSALERLRAAEQGRAQSDQTAAVATAKLEGEAARADASGRREEQAHQELGLMRDELAAEGARVREGLTREKEQAALIARLQSERPAVGDNEARAPRPPGAPT